LREDACRRHLFSCVENGFPLFRKLNQKRACAIVPLFSRRQLHKKVDLCNFQAYFDKKCTTTTDGIALIAQRVQRAMLFRANKGMNNSTAGDIKA